MEPAKSMPSSSPREKKTLSSSNHKATDFMSDVFTGKFRPLDLPTEYRLAIHLNTQKFEPDEVDLLEFIWSGGLDSPCMICGEVFLEKEPPVRTISLESICSVDEHLHTALRVHNRHRSCIETEKVEYIPISHVWHQTVAEAQNDHWASMEATRDVCDTVVRVLIAATSYNKRKIEIWHDYFSIPQWQYALQQQLLLKLPHIYAYPEYIILHIHDLDSWWIHNIVNTPLEDFDDQTFDCADRLNNCQYFSRMWVVLEQVVSKYAVLLKREWSIVSLPRERIQDTYDVLLSVLAHGNIDTVIMNGLDSMARALLSLLYCFTVAQPNNMGVALYDVAERHCRMYRDRFLAMHGLLFWNSETKTDIPSDQFEACHWLARKCLARGDYTPLLLKPSPEEVSRSPFWVTGHSHMNRNTWDLGEQTLPPETRVILRDGDVRPTLQVFGHIQEAKSFSTDILGELGPIENVIAITGADPHAFARAMESVYPTPVVDEPGRFQNPLSLNDMGQLRTSLERFVNAQHIRGSESTGIWTELSNLGIKKDKPFDPFFYHGENDYDYLCTIICPNCATIFVLRLELWNRPGVNANLYRIPGLKYTASFRDGVGLVIENNIIIGRMVFGIQSCKCEELEMREVLIL